MLPAKKKLFILIFIGNVHLWVTEKTKIWSQIKSITCIFHKKFILLYVWHVYFKNNNNDIIKLDLKCTYAPNIADSYSDSFTVKPGHAFSFDFMLLLIAMDDWSSSHDGYGYDTDVILTLSHHDWQRSAVSEWRPDSRWLCKSHQSPNLNK